MVARLPSRYEDLDPTFRGRLRPDAALLALVQRANRSMQISGGIRFLPIFGRSGSGKSSAARELSTHLPETRVIELTRLAISSESALRQELRDGWGSTRERPSLLIAVVDEYEERVPENNSLPAQFIERLSLLDRSEEPVGLILFIWLTTSRSFQRELAEATSRNERILLSSTFELQGPKPDQWADIVEETFAFHNQDQPLADFEILRSDVEDISESAPTLGRAIEMIGDKLAEYVSPLQDLSHIQVIILWPVTDGLRITRILGFTNPREGYKLDWNAFYRELNTDDRDTLPLAELNRARLYFDVRLVPIAAADLQPLCRNLDKETVALSQSYLQRFQLSHFVTLIDESWNPAAYSPMRERDSQRARDARAWYEGVTSEPVALGRRLALILKELGYAAAHEQRVTSPHSTVRADVLVQRQQSTQDQLIIELKAFGPDNTMPSTIKDAIRQTLRKHAQLGGFLARQ